MRGELLVLSWIADAALGVRDDLTMIGLLASGEQARQRALTGPVLPDDPGAFTRVKRAGARTEDRAAVEGLADR